MTQIDTEAIVSPERILIGLGFWGMKEAGFTPARVEHLVGPDSMVIGLK